MSVSGRAPAPLLSLVKVGKSYKRSVVLRDFDLDLLPGRIHALLGQNGAGKSTAVRLMTGVEQPSAGEILLEGAPCLLPDPAAARRNGIITVHQELQVFTDISVAENIFVGRIGQSRGLSFIKWPAIQRAARELLGNLGVDIDVSRPLGQFGAGVRQIVEIARAMLETPRILVLDEPTARLSGSETDRLFKVLRELRERGVAILLIAHDLAQVFAIADEVTVLRDGVRIATSPVRATSRDEVIEWMVGARVEAGAATPARPAGGVPLLAASGLTTGSGAAPFSLEARAGEIVGLAGVVGSGAEEIGRQIGGVAPLRTGQVRLAGVPVRFGSPFAAIAAGVVSMPPDRKAAGLFFNMTVTGNVVASVIRRFARVFVLSEKLMRDCAQTAIGTLGIRPPDPGSPVGQLSGGNQQKVLFARILQAKPRLIILNNPTVGVDVAAQADIHAVIRQVAAQGVGVVVISTDFAELSALCGRIMVVRAGEIVDEIVGTVPPELILAKVTGELET